MKANRKIYTFTIDLEDAKNENVVLEIVNNRQEVWLELKVVDVMDVERKCFEIIDILENKTILSDLLHTTRYDCQVIVSPNLIEILINGQALYTRTVRIPFASKLNTSEFCCGVEYKEFDYRKYKDEQETYERVMEEAEHDEEVKKLLEACFISV
jgi:hypothetical protein